MLIPLEPADYQTVFALFSAPVFSVEMLSILDGNTRGRIFVDDPDSPRYALGWDELATLFVAGPPEGAADPGSFSAALHAWIAETAIPHAQRWGIPDLTLVYDPPTWGANLAVLSSKYRLTSAERHHYTHTRASPPAAELPPGYILQAINAELLARTNLPGLDWLGGWILSFWPTPEAFLDRGLGYVILTSPEEGSEPTLVSLCVSVFVSGAAYEFGTATDEAHRSRGLSTAATGACVNAGLARGIDPVWHCWADNGPSMAVARKAGFRLEGHHEVLRLWLPESESQSRQET
jgi:RimJ/RimL family protein N-acetyltransferase